MADVNGDGLLDIYVCQVGKYKTFNGRNQLFINQGNLTFKDEAHEYGLDFQGFSTQAAFFDFDNDGDLDMYLLNHSVHTSKSYGDVSLRLDHDPLAGDRLFRNDEVNGKRVFHDITRSAGIYDSQIGYGLGINVSDINNDGYPDIYISNDFHENDYLYINNGNGTFTEKSREALRHTSRSSMGNDVADINNDGLPDIMVLDMLPDEEKIRKSSGGEDDYELFQLKLKYGYNYQFVRNTLQLNLGDGLFSEIGLLAGVSSTDWSWSPLLCDVDNDGWKDLFITNGIYRRANDLDYVKFLTGGNRRLPSKDNSKLSDRDLYEKMPLYPNVNYIFRNNGNLTFTNKAAEWGFNKKSYSNGSTYADLDNDGDEDLIVNNINEKAYILRNNAEQNESYHYLSIAFKGPEQNQKGIGTRVTIYSGTLKQVAEQFTTHGFLSATADLMHFGLGNNNTVDSLVVNWPGQRQQTLKNVAANQTITLDIANSESKKATLHLDNSKTVFIPSVIKGLEFTHKEDEWVDFYREKLIPHSLSAEGPALAVADINGDGLEDIFAGGAKGQPGIILMQHKDGSFMQVDNKILNEEIGSDQVDAIFFDADGDGDSDLFIARGGNELLIGNPLLKDLLLINDGKGGFTKGDLPLISHNASCVRACDFDNDGDMDLFLGSRSIPAAYGWPPDQYLLENDGHGHFKDITASKSEGLRNIGMVTDAAWVDYDGDGDKDLIVVGEWMNISVFRNDNGHFINATQAAGLDQTSGWWSCIQIADINGDGKPDFIAGNLGLNSMLKASIKEPAEMYLSDFDNNGSLDQIICTYMNGASYPFASLDELESQIAGLDKKFTSYSGFGGKKIDEIFGKKEVEQAVLKKAVHFESSFFINNGDGTFKISDLPVEAQFSPIRNILAQDYNKDGITDLLLGGNDYAVRPSYGRYDASYGWFLEGNARQSFNTLMPAQSGFKVSGDARKIAHIKISGKQFIIAAVNNGKLQIFQVSE
jgi:enediyne biosynthesis protein E4